MSLRTRSRNRMPDDTYLTRSYEIMKNNEKNLEEINSKLGAILLLLTKLVGDNGE